MVNNIKLKELEEQDILIRITTQEEWNKCMEFFEGKGIGWTNEESATQKNFFAKYKEETTISIVLGELAYGGNHNWKRLKRISLNTLLHDFKD